MRNPKLREITNRTLNHLAMGMMLGVLLAIGLLFGNSSKVFACGACLRSCRRPA